MSLQELGTLLAYSSAMPLTPGPDTTPSSAHRMPGA